MHLSHAIRAGFHQVSLLRTRAALFAAASGLARPGPACLGLACLGLTSNVHAQEPPAAAPSAHCLPGGDGYVRARISGVLEAELNWGNEGTECTGAVRPTDGGIRMRFSRIDPADDSKLVLVFGIAKLREGQPAKLLPVNVTVMREGKGEFYSTQGDDKCMFDEVRQEPLVGIPHRARSYRVVARGFCTEPARAVHGKGAVLMSRFDIAGRVDFGSEDDSDDLLAAPSAPSDLAGDRRLEAGLRAAFASAFSSERY